MVGEERVKKGAYLAGLANGPSVAQDLGLSPKDRLIAVEGLDVKTVPFERIGEFKFWKWRLPTRVVAKLSISLAQSSIGCC